uniref:non-specific serine/threonine protein kinase n=1 Tax=Dracunculus medinensis TaxID=318479 RepID=A0A0N4U7W5_DRAME
LLPGSPSELIYRSQPFPYIQLIYEFQVLGRGHSGSVHVAVRKSDGKKFALKVLLDLPQARREVELQYAAQGPNVVEIKDVYANIYCERRCLFVVMEHMGGGQLFDRIKQGQLTERDAARIMQQLCSAVAHLHSLNIAHRDIKPENVLYSSNGILKLCDFGFAKRIEESAEKPLHTVCYSNYYAPPEILQRLCYDKSCDMWSLGVVMYILLCGYPPFYSKSGDDFSMGMQRRIKAGQYDFPSPEWDFISDQAKALIKNLLVTDPCQRLTIEQLMQSEWITHCIIAPKTPLHTSKMLTEEQMQDINVFILSFFQNF